MERPETRYARSGDASIAYQLFGKGPAEVLLAPGPASHVEVIWEYPDCVRFFGQLARFAHVALFDRRGSGLSDPVEQPPTFELQVEDLLAVADAVGFERPAIMGIQESTRMAVLAAALHPDRFSALALLGPTARGAAVMNEDALELVANAVETGWGQGQLANLFAPHMTDDPEFMSWWGRYERSSCSPGMAKKLARLSAQSDISKVLADVRQPALVTRRRGDPMATEELVREVVDLMPDARYVEVPGEGSLHQLGDPTQLMNELESFLAGEHESVDPDRVLATVLFTDVVDSTARAAELGDMRWRDLLDHHDEVLRRQLERFGGLEVKHTGDGILATFDGPARGVRCAAAAVTAMERAGLPIRAGLHTGECERRGSDVGGMAVHIGARVCSEAGPSEILVTSTVKDLVIGSGLSFEERGPRQLKGVPEELRLYAAAGAAG
jgi:class 3 adenylate cyclase